jgi:hypothetical protein
LWGIKYFLQVFPPVSQKYLPNLSGYYDILLRTKGFGSFRFRLHKAYVTLPEMLYSFPQTINTVL